MLLSHQRVLCGAAMTQGSVINIGNLNRFYIWSVMSQGKYICATSKLTFLINNCRN